MKPGRKSLKKIEECANRTNLIIQKYVVQVQIFWGILSDFLWLAKVLGSIEGQYANFCFIHLKSINDAGHGYCTAITSRKGNLVKKDEYLQVLLLGGCKNARNFLKGLQIYLHIKQG